MNKDTDQHELALEELRSLYDLVRSLHDADGRDNIVTAFLERLHDVVAFDSCAVMLSDDASGSFEITHAAGEHAASLVGRKIVAGEGISGWVVVNRHPFCNTDPRLDLPSTLIDRFENYRTLAVFPILKGNDLFGAVALYSSSLSKYDSTQQRLLTEASALLALALSAVSQAARSGVPAQETSEVDAMSRMHSYNAPSIFPIHIPASEHSH
jgi:GAF domain-containing protein